MFDFKTLESRYMHDAAFNKVVNLYRQLLQEYGFTPSELRQAAFFAQYIFEMNQAEQIIRTDREWEQINEARKILQQAVLNIEDFCKLKT